MFYPMVFEPIEFSNNVTVRALRTRSYKSLSAAVAALLKSHKEGYIKQHGVYKPVYSHLNAH